MNKSVKTITSFVALIALGMIVGAIITELGLPAKFARFASIQTRQYLDSRGVTLDEDAQTGSNILHVGYDENHDTLKLDFVGGGSQVVRLDPSALEMQVFEIQNLGKPVYLRFYSPAFYKSYGQTNPGVIILTRTNPSELTDDPDNKIAADFRVADQPTAADLSFAVLHSYLKSHNKVDTERPLCTAKNANELLVGVASSSCYVDCQGLSEIAAQFLTASTQIVRMWSRVRNLDNGFTFLSSEMHTTLEIFDNNTWYVADPTYGFAYVKDATGQRLSTKDLITALEKQNANELTFGLVYNGVIHEVPGDLVVKANTTMAGIYYTPDKRLDYKVIKGTNIP
jgi:hypothetical protein